MSNRSHAAVEAAMKAGLAENKRYNRVLRLLRNVESMLYRRSTPGLLDGRNSAASDEHLDFSLHRVNDELCLLEDEFGVGHPAVEALSRRYNKAERRYVGLPV